ncbi:4-(cytidine 5'-diphospho)-2-C-methyl-D-erythritol kinase [candidate division CSSED10-310 bacterium]|uniref:4-diphosphocytidyl-2-C-methyl-D-erythritol kinase n=1 Tax=candidate division CSSED10-310 bacterium TaxID=2855610 RepID=A0ABV6YUU3_UNCC1
MYNLKGSIQDGVIRIKARAKINLYLRVICKRSDGYHELVTLFQEIDLADTLTFAPAPKEIILSVNCPSLPDNEDNLVLKAARLLQTYTHPPLGAAITLEKKIPLAAGLGGGSSDAAATLIGLTQLWQLTLSQSELGNLAAQLGADVPFFIHGGTALGRGRGDEIEPISPLPPEPILLLKPKLRISSAWVYKNYRVHLTKSAQTINITNLIKDYKQKRALKTLLRNDLEEVVLSRFPEVERLKSLLLEKGAQIALLSGSGPTVFGLFEGAESRDQAYQALEGEKNIYCRKAHFYSCS